MNKKILIAAMALPFALAACGGSDKAAKAEKTPAPQEPKIEAAAPEGAPALQAVIVPSLPDLSPETLGSYIKTLASDEFEGRAPAQPGGEKTREFLVQTMKDIGLKPANGASYEQPVPLVETTADPTQSHLTITKADGQKHVLAQREETVFWTKRVVENVAFDNSEMVFVGYGVVAPEYDWDDYAGIDVTGKTVVMLVNDPGFTSGDPASFNGKSMTYYGRWTYKFEEAARQGAVAALVIHQTEPAAYGWGVVEGSWTGAQLDLERPDGGASRVALEGWLTHDTADKLFTAAGLDLSAQEQAAVKKGFAPVPMTGLSAAGKITNTIKRSTSANVAGMIKGTTDPDNFVLYMAHWDHLGIKAGDGDTIANGAVDNGTGVGGMLTIAKSFSDADQQPERSILFVAVTAEESGLLGSAYFAEAPLVPFKNIVGGLNMDGMLPTSPAKDIIVIGYGASELETLLDVEAKKRGKYLRPDAEPEKGYFYRSDHISLAKKGVPMLYADSGIDLIEGGEAAGKAAVADYTANRYHKPGDEYSDDWDLSGLLQTMEILRDVGAAMAYSDAQPNWHEGNEFRALRDAQMAE